MRIHVPAFPHTETIREWCTCAFTDKTRKLGAMLNMTDHEMILYAGEHNDAPCELVTVVTEMDRWRWFQSETWKDRVFDRFDPDDQCWSEMNAKVIEEVGKRIEPGDAIGITMGYSQKAVADAFPNNPAIEVGIGYEGVFANYRVFESYAWMHYLYGRDHINDGRFFDAVIPNAFDLEDFNFEDKKDDYLLFLGRHIPRKGLAVVEEIAKHHRVLTAGQGDVRVPGAEYVGVVRGKERAYLLAKATALIAPTFYIEPFGGVAVEAQLSGTPVITTDFGVFPETVKQGVTGFRCHVLREFIDAVEQVKDLDPRLIRERAVRKYSLQSVSVQYARYLDRISLLQGEGWYA